MAGIDESDHPCKEYYRDKVAHFALNCIGLIVILDGNLLKLTHRLIKRGIELGRIIVCEMYHHKNKDRKYPSGVQNIVTDIFTYLKTSKDVGMVVADLNGGISSKYVAILNQLPMCKYIIITINSTRFGGDTSIAQIERINTRLTRFNDEFCYGYRTDEKIGPYQHEKGLANMIFMIFRRGKKKPGCCEWRTRKITIGATSIIQYHGIPYEFPVSRSHALALLNIQRKNKRKLLKYAMARNRRLGLV
jgi:hypothetical protein